MSVRPSLLMALPAAAFAVTAALFLAGLQRNEEGGMQSSLIGRTAPVVDLRQLGDGPPPDHADLTAKQVKLVNFWASWCAPCRVEHSNLQALSERGIPIFGINYKDSPENALGFLTELGNPFHRIGADRQGRTAIDWGVYGVPETFVVDAAGIVRMRWAGPITGRILSEQIIPAISQARGN